MNESIYECVSTSLNGNRIDMYKNPAFAGWPTLIFLHDSLGSIELWRDFPLKLGQAVSCNVLVYERSGHGQSTPLGQSIYSVNYLETEADRLEELVHQYGINDAILFGHSDGGSIALLAAAKYGHRIRAVIAEAAHIFVEDITLAGIRQAVTQYEAGDLRSRLWKYHGLNTETLFWRWANTWLSPAYRNWSIESFLPAIQCPLLLIQGENDAYGTSRQVERIASQTVGVATEYMVPGVGHTPHKEAPAETLSKATQFILETI